MKVGPIVTSILVALCACALGVSENLKEAGAILSIEILDVQIAEEGIISYSRVSNQTEQTLCYLSGHSNRIFLSVFRAKDGADLFSDDEHGPSSNASEKVFLRPIDPGSIVKVEAIAFRQDFDFFLPASNRAERFREDELVYVQAGLTQILCDAPSIEKAINNRKFDEALSSKSDEFVLDASP